MESYLKLCLQSLLDVKGGKKEVWGDVDANIYFRLFIRSDKA